jgi:broad specificity phosphatase PhoE
MKKTIVFIRHAEGSHQDELYKEYDTMDIKPFNDPFHNDSRLNTKGHEQATMFGLYHKSLGLVFDHIYCSPSRRVIETCDHIVKGKDVIVDDKLIEYKSIEECNIKHNKRYLTNFTKIRDNIYHLDNVDDNFNEDKYLGIKYIIKNEEELIFYNTNKTELESQLSSVFGEKIDVKIILVYKRIYEFIENILNNSAINSDKIIVFTHGGWIKSLLKLYKNEDINKPKNCSEIKVTLNPLDPIIIEKINRCIHLIENEFEKLRLYYREKDINIDKLFINSDLYSKYLKYKNKYMLLNKKYI